MFEKHLWKSDILSKDAGHRHGRFDMTVCSSQIRVDINAVFFSCFSIFWGIQRSERNLRKFGDLRRFKEILYLKSDAFFKFFIFSLNNLSVIDNSAWRLFQESCSTNWPHIYQISHKTFRRVTTDSSIKSSYFTKKHQPNRFLLRNVKARYFKMKNPIDIFPSMKHCGTETQTFSI